MITDDKNKIGNRLLNARNRLNLTQAQAAERAGISEKTYSNIERGRSNMSIASLCKICRALEITPDLLLVDDPADQDITSDAMIQDALKKLTCREKDGAAHILNAYMKALHINSVK